MLSGMRKVPIGTQVKNTMEGIRKLGRVGKVGVPFIVVRHTGVSRRT